MTVLRIDNSQSHGFIVHIRVEGVSITNPSAAGGISSAIEYLPFAVSSIDTSVLNLDTVGTVPDFHEGYRHWRDALDRGEANVWTDSVSKVISLVESVVARTQ